MQLETDRLILREFAFDDWPAVDAYTSDPLVVQYMDFGPTTAEQTQEHLRWCIANSQERPRRIYEMAIMLRAEQRVIGTATLCLLEDERRNAAFSYLLHRQYWRQGYASEAMRVLITFGFTELKLHRVSDTCDARNHASAHVMEKLGMRREGHVREVDWRRGQWCDAYIYGILAHEWVTPTVSVTSAEDLKRS